MNLAHVMLLRGHVALARYAGGHHGRRAERHQIGLVRRSFVRLMRMASGACADVQELARWASPVLSFENHHFTL